MIVAALLMSANVCAPAQTGPLHRIVVKSPKKLQEFLRYTPDRIPLVSTHRGGSRPGFPENCIPTFENTLRHTWSALEIDPRYTKDSVIVLMHDPTLDRTTTGTGKVSDYSYAQLQQLQLKDSEGKPTSYKIPTLDEVIRWAKGKTLLVIDQKDVPVSTLVKIIQKHKAQAWVVPIVYGGAENIRKTLDLEPELVMEVMIPDAQTLQNFENAGIPARNLVAFTTHTQVKDTTLYQQLHEKGIMCIRGSSRTIDRDFVQGKIDRQELEESYRAMITSGTDIIEADLGIEAGKALESLIPRKSPMLKFLEKG